PSKDVDEVLRCHLKEPLTPPDHLNQQLSAGLGEVVELLMAKSRRQRYQKADDLIIDLECLLAGEPPKLARQGIGANTVKGLAEGEADEQDAGAPPGQLMTWVWMGVLAGLLGLSLLFNVILLLRH